MTCMLAVSSLPLDDVQQICLVLGILYLAECLWWLRGNAYRLYASPFTAWSEAPGDAPRVNAWRFGLANPLPGTESFAAETFPFPFDAVSLLLPRFDAVTCRECFEVLPFDAIEAITSSERDVLFGTRTVGSFSSTAFAQATASRLERIRSAAAVERAEIAESIVADIWDYHKAKSRLDAWRKAARFLREWGATLSVLGLGAAPLAWACRHWLPQNLPLILVAMCVVLWFAVAIRGMLLHGDFLPPDGKTAMHRTIACLSPATAMRLYDTLGRDVLAAYEPLVVALLSGSGHRDTTTTAAFLRDALHPAGGPTVAASDAAAQETVDKTIDWFRSRMGRHARQAVRKSGLDPDALLTQLPIEQGVCTYCPRCSRQFTTPGGVCGFCSQPLLAFDAARGRSNIGPDTESS